MWSDNEPMKYKVGDRLVTYNYEEVKIVDKGSLRWLIGEWLKWKFKGYKVKFPGLHNDVAGGYVIQYKNGNYEVVSSWFVDKEFKKV